jgi:hypothetical protein
VAEQGAEVTIAGTVDVGERAPYVRARTVVHGVKDVEFSVTEELVVVTAEGTRIRVIAAEAVVRPERDHADTWRRIRAHTTRPPGDFHLEGHVAIKGVWIAPGESVCVIGRATEHSFVEGTGGQRKAPVQAIAELAAIAIGVGKDRASAADEAREIYEEQRKIAITLAWFAATISCFVAELMWKHGTLGLAVSCAFLGLSFMWWASPTKQFPGGASDSKAGGWDGAVVTLLLLFLIVPMVGFLVITASSPGARTLGGCAPIMLIGPLPIFMAWKAVLTRPRAVPGVQLELPAHRVARWALLVGLLALWIAALALCIPQISADGPTL